MRILRFPLLSLLMTSVALLPGAVRAQTYSTVPQPQPDADALAAAVRTLGTNPRNIDALVTAGDLSLRLGDASAAAAFYARAEKIDARNGRVKAGEAALLVHEERPGEALRYFDQAVGYGIDPARFAAERGLAYDLIGEPDRAQRDYRLALRSGGDNSEVVRRYALSLGISGKRDLALQQLEPLLRQSDRGAWRARAFILAMTGDVAGASKIATTMMPPGMATGLQPFFERLPALPAADRAFAVHFGEVRATPARLADARMVPALPALGADPTAPVAVASQPAAPAVQVATRADTRKGQRPVRRSGKQVAQAKPKPPAYALQMVQSLPASSTATARAGAPTAPATTPTAMALVPAPVTTASTQPRPTPAPTPVQSRAVVPAPPAAVPVPQVPQVSQFSTAFATSQARWEAEKRAEQRRAAEASIRAAATPAAGGVTAEAKANATVAAATPATPAALPAPAALSVRASAASSPPTAPSAGPPIATVTPGGVTLRQPLADPIAAQPAVAAASPAPSPRSGEPVAAAPPRMTDDSILAKIIANIKIPDSERATAAPAGTAPTRDVAAAGGKIAADKRAAAAKALADKKALSVRKAAADKAAADGKALADKKAAEEKLAKADPPRIWVQVAGGANAADLAKAWKGARGKASALKGKSAYSTPLRATNRLVTGPFKTDDEAQAFVNTLAKQGVSAFTFTSVKGQKLTPVGGK